MKAFFILPHCIFLSFKKLNTAIAILLMLLASNVHARSLPTSGNAYTSFVPAGVHNFYFGGTISKGQSLLTWQTSDEQNSKDFLVQHSTDGIHWSAIDSVRAATNSISVKNYSYMHSKPVPGCNYYRLIQRDIDNSYTYSKIVNLVYKSYIRQLNAFPNPVSNSNLYVQLPQAALVNLYSNTGALVLQKYSSAGTQAINVTSLPKGSYILKAAAETKQIIVE
jgi:hypothetical protein